MQSNSNTKNTKSENNGSIIDASGKPVKSPASWRDRWRHISSKVKVTAIAIVAFVALLATFLANIEKIGNYFKPTPSVPAIVVKLSNSSNEDVTVAQRGDFILWLPGPDAYHTMGKYEFLTIEGKSPSADIFTIPPKKTITVLAKVMNGSLYANILSRADCDLSLLVYRAGAGLVSTNDIPFTKDAIKKYFIETDVGKR